MRKRGFYSRLAAVSVRKNGKFYLPYFLTGAGCCAMFYIMIYLCTNEGVNAMRGAQYVESALVMGSVVIALFSAVILFYTNSFLMKRRRRELGLYNILGMEKRHIARIMFWETVISAAAGVVGGLAVGIILSKLVLLLLCKLVSFEIPFGFNISVEGIGLSAIVFGVIYSLNLMVNFRFVGRAKPVELLHSENTSEREPKTRWVLTVIGLLALGGGYALSFTVKSPTEAILLFFIAVILVIIGTFCLFTAGSIAWLKILRRRRGYYYKTRHFITVSGMLHRMKRNASGLATVCILCTMVLVTVSSTVCLYLGTEDSLARQFPYDINMEFRDASDSTIALAASTAKEVAARDGVAISEPVVITEMHYTNMVSGDTISDRGTGEGSTAVIHIISDDSYSILSGTDTRLESGQILLEVLAGQFSFGQTGDVLKINGKRFTITAGSGLGNYTQNLLITSYIMIIMDYDDMQAIKYRSEEYSDSILSSVSFNVTSDLGSERESEFAEAVADELNRKFGSGEYSFESFYRSCRADSEDDLYSMHGGFFFLGLFLGTLFLMATVLIIYYKQVSEGYEDAGRFKIMQQVGMSESEVRSSIRSQIITVFFLPLVAAAIHIAAAFPMLSRMFTLFSLYNVPLFAICCFATLCVFAVVYVTIYLLTARAYYHIVKY